MVITRVGALIVPVDVILPELIPAAVTPPVMLAPAAVTVPTVVKPAPIVAPSVTANASDEIVPADVKLPLKLRLLNASPPVTARLPPIDTLPVVVNAPALIPPPIVKPAPLIVPVTDKSPPINALGAY